MNPYIGHASQLYGIEGTCLVGGKGDGMRLLQVRNAAGLTFTVAADRCADLYRLAFHGTNMGYFAPCGYVGPKYYREPGKGFLQSFTAGFLTTCGLNHVGAPVVDQGEALPLHGTVGNTPASKVWYEVTEDMLLIHAEVHDEVLFGRKFVLHRTLSCPVWENKLTLTDRVENLGSTPEPVRLMYHINMGYPLLSEHTVLTVPSTQVMRGTEAVTDRSWLNITPPEPGKPEVCYRHTYRSGEQGCASVYNPEIKKGLLLRFDTAALPCLIQWNKFASRDYALGLEPRSFVTGNRELARQTGEMFFLEPGKSRTYQVTFEFFED